MTERFENHVVVARMLVGSHNYNLNTENSDKDFKMFVAPTFEDLYKGKMFAHAETSETVDFDVHDIRQFANLLWGANVNFVETLFSVEKQTVAELAPVFVRAHSLATMNLPKFWRATYGTHVEKMKTLRKGTAKTQVLVETFGYDTKQACHALRCLFTLSRFVRFRNMQGALWFEPWEREGQTLMAVKTHALTEAAFLALVEDWHKNEKARVDDFFAATEEDLETKMWLENFTREFVKKFLFE